MVKEGRIQGVINYEGRLEGTISAANNTIYGEVTCPFVEYYEGTYNVVPKPNQKQTLPTAKKYLQEDVSVSEIPYYVVSNNTGSTVYIGKEIKINGN